MLSSEPVIERVCAEQVDPLKFLSVLRWLDGRPLLDVIPLFWQHIFEEALFTFRPDGAPLYQRVLTGMGKKNLKTLMAVLAALYKLCVWEAAGSKGNQAYVLASDLGQADDDLDLTKKLIRANPVLEAELTIKVNVIERRDGVGFAEILPAKDADGLHGKTYLFKVHDELHTQRDYRALEALELDRTRPDAMAWFASYASPWRHASVPLVDMLKQHEAGTDPRLFVRWYAGSVEAANPALNTPLGPTRESIEDAQRGNPSWVFRRLYLNLPGQPDGAALDPDKVEQCVVAGRRVLSPVAQRQYVAFADPGSGGDDDFSLAIAHAEPDGRVVLDLLQDQGPRTGRTYSPARAVERHAAVLKQYGCCVVTGDNHAKNWPQEEFGKLDVMYLVAKDTRSDLYTQLEPLLNAGRVELLDHPMLVAQLLGLVRKGERIDHPSAGLVAHDDLANASAGALVLAAPARRELACVHPSRDMAAVDPAKLDGEDAAIRKATEEDAAQRMDASLKRFGWAWPGEY